MNRSPLYQLHKGLGAAFAESSGWDAPQTFGGVDAEYRAAREGAALVDRSPLGRVRLTGDEALDLLHRISTNDLESLQPGHGAATVLTSGKGRVIDWISVLRTGDGVLLQTAPETPKAVAEWIDKYAIIEEITLEDLTQDTVQIAVLGPQAAAVVGGVAGEGIAELPLYGNLRAPWSDGELLVVRSDPVGLPGYDLVAPAAEGVALWDRLAAAGAVPLGQTAWEALRIEAGVPRWGAEIDERYNPLEANLGRDIDWVKGCYIGQEVVARLNTYHKVQKYLVTVAFEPGSAPVSGAPLLVDGATAGALTSAAYSPAAARTIGLGYLRTQHVRPNAQVTAVTEGGQAVVGVVTRAPEVPEAALSTAAVLALLGGDAEEEE